MGEVLMRDETPEVIWAQHEAMLDAVIAADGDAAERLAREHIRHAAEIAIERLAQAARPAPGQRGRATSARHPVGFIVEHAMARGGDRPLDHADESASAGQGL